MAPVDPSADILRWPVKSHWHRLDDCNCAVFAIIEHTKLLIGLCDINEWWRGHKLHPLGRLGRNFCVSRDLFTISPQRKSWFELSYRGNLQKPVEFKIVRTEKKIRTEPPVELAQCRFRVALTCNSILHVMDLNTEHKSVSNRKWDNMTLLGQRFVWIFCLVAPCNCRFIFISIRGRMAVGQYLHLHVQKFPQNSW